MEDGTEDSAGKNGSHRSDFGNCCGELKEALSGEGFEPFLLIGEDNILYLAVGEVDIEDDQRNFVDHPIFFCPFCGTKLQERDEVMARINAGDGGEQSE